MIAARLVQSSKKASPSSMIFREPLDPAEQRLSIRKTALAEVDRVVGDRGRFPVVFRESGAAQPG